MNIRILHTNDIHSRFENFAKIISKIKEIKNENTLILDGGDFHDFMRVELQGTMGRAGCSLLNIGEYDAIAVGNNESFAGVKPLETMISSELITFLSCNLYRKDMSYIKGLRKSIIVERGGMKFLIIGATPPMNEFLSLLNIYVSDPAEEIEKEIEKNRGKYDICILLSHCGITYDLSFGEKIKGIDIIIGGHSHTLMENAKEINGSIIHQSGSYGEYLGVLDIEIKDGKIMSFTEENIKVEDLPLDSEITHEISKQKEIAVEVLSQPLYKLNCNMWHDVVEENPITNLLADALRDVISCDLSIINSGIISGGIRKGEVSNKKLLEISPSPLNPTYMEIEGKYIKEALKLSLQSDICLQDGKGAGFRGRYLGRLHVSSNVTIEHDGKNILKVKLENGEVEDEKIYKVATSDYLQRGTGYPSLSNNYNEKYNAEYIRDTLRDYLCNKEFVENSFRDRWVKTS